MPEISNRALILIIQAVDREINRLTDVPDEVITSVEELLLADYQALAAELEALYAEACKTETHLPDYSSLVTDRRQAPD
ncbi:MAG: hypothetical protein GVY09_10915 [Gammaproteobacteria bacterium]|jgi:uncharacterized membrane-anchored protein|nr:hypothetical protein [Gammaproteobacteria bacterium]